MKHKILDCMLTDCPNLLLCIFNRHFFCVTHFSRQFPLIYGRHSKILNTCHFLFLKKMCVFSAGIHKILVRIANREDPDQAASSEKV